MMDYEDDFWIDDPFTDDDSSDEDEESMTCSMVFFNLTFFLETVQEWRHRELMTVFEHSFSCKKPKCIVTCNLFRSARKHTKGCQSRPLYEAFQMIHISECKGEETCAVSHCVVGGGKQKVDLPTTFDQTTIKLLNTCIIATSRTRVILLRDIPREIGI